MHETLHYTRPADRLSPEDIDPIVALALAEDAPEGDATSDSIFDQNDQSLARIVAREEGVLCGGPVLARICAQPADAGLQLRQLCGEGQRFVAGDVLFELEGPTRVLLRLERVLLNFLQCLSGIASLTARAAALAPEGVYLLDTRKTLPGYRRLAKYAVFCGGGVNHRLNLSEMAMIKDNHIAAAGSIRAAVEKVRSARPGIPLEVEVDRLEQLEEALPLAPDFILLDNMNAAQIAAAVARVQAHAGPHPRLEVSGGWKPEQLPQLRGLGPLGVSMGHLTHSARFLDLSLEIVSGSGL